MKKFSNDFVRYTDARLPILYVDTFEEDKVKNVIRNICKKNHRKVIEWSLSGALNYSENMVLPKMDLAGTFNLLLEDVDNSFQNTTLVL